MGALQTGPRLGAEEVAGNRPSFGTGALHAAILRINESLDPDIVLGEAVARARAGAHFGVIAVVDEVAPGRSVFALRGRDGTPDTGTTERLHRKEH